MPPLALRSGSGRSGLPPSAVQRAESMMGNLMQLSTGVLTILAASTVSAPRTSTGVSGAAARADSRRPPSRSFSTRRSTRWTRVRGVLAALEGEFVEGETIEIDAFNAQGDVATSNTIAKEVIENYDVIVTSSTISLQTVANANRFRDPPRLHSSSLTSNPFSERGCRMPRTPSCIRPTWRGSAVCLRFTNSSIC